MNIFAFIINRICKNCTHSLSASCFVQLKAKEQVKRLALFWCGRRDLNPHELAFTRT